MANKYLKPLRGKKASAIHDLIGDACLKKGEIFFEIPDTGISTGAGKIKMGDGESDYADLPYFITSGGDYDDIIGNTDISGIADGTLTGATDIINTNMEDKFEKKDFVPLDGDDIIPTVALEITNDMITAQNMSGSINFNQDEVYESGQIPKFQLPFNIKSPSYIIIKFADNFNKTTSQFNSWSLNGIKINNDYYFIRIDDMNYYYSQGIIYNPSTEKHHFISGYCYKYPNVQYGVIVDLAPNYQNYDYPDRIIRSDSVRIGSNSWSYYTYFGIYNNYKIVNAANSGEFYKMQRGQIAIQGNYIINLYVENSTWPSKSYMAWPNSSFLLFVVSYTMTTSGPYPSAATSGVYYISHGGFASATAAERGQGKNNAPKKINLAQTSTAPCTITATAGSGGSTSSEAEPARYGYLKIQGATNKYTLINIMEIF